MAKELEVQILEKEVSRLKEKELLSKEKIGELDELIE